MKEIIPLSIKQKIRQASDGPRIYNFGTGAIPIPAYTVYYYYRGLVYWGTALNGDEFVEYLKQVRKPSKKSEAKRNLRHNAKVHPLVAQLQNVELIFDADDQRMIMYKERKNSLSCDIWCEIIDKWRTGTRICDLQSEYGVCSAQIYYYARRINNIVAARNAVGSAI